MPRGFCAKCGREIGTFLFTPTAWQCPRCQKLFCNACCPKVGIWPFKKPACPDCGIELKK